MTSTVFCCLVGRVARATRPVPVSLVLVPLVPVSLVPVSLVSYHWPPCHWYPYHHYGIPFRVCRLWYPLKLLFRVFCRQGVIIIIIIILRTDYYFAPTDNYFRGVLASRARKLCHIYTRVIYIYIYTYLLTYLLTDSLTGILTDSLTGLLTY